MGRTVLITLCLEKCCHINSFSFLAPWSISISSQAIFGDPLTFTCSFSKTSIRGVVWTIMGNETFRELEGVLTIDGAQCSPNKDLSRFSFNCSHNGGTTAIVMSIPKEEVTTEINKRFIRYVSEIDE